MQQSLTTLGSQIGQTGPMLYKKKNGSQQAIKLPMINPRIRVARRSFFLAILFRSFSASCIEKQSHIIYLDVMLLYLNRVWFKCVYE